MKKSCYAFLMTLTPAVSAATELIALCQDPHGSLIRYQQATGKPKVEDDGFKEATWSFHWDSTLPNKGTITTQNSKSAGGGLDRNVGPAVPNLPSYVTFFTPFERTLWMYTIFPDLGILMASRHGLGLPGETAVGGTFHGKCKVTVR